MNIPLGQLLSNLNELSIYLHQATPETHILAVTVFHAGVVMAQVGNIIACRSEKLRVTEVGVLSNPLIWVGIFAEIAIILMLIYIPPLARMFEHAPLPIEFWFYLSLFAPILYSLDRLRKMLLYFFSTTWGKKAKAMPNHLHEEVI